jgi:hypothetical protein
VVEWCSRNARLTAIAGGVLGAAALVFTAGHFAMSSDTAGLMSPKLDWRQREIAFDRAFPGQGDSIVVVIDAATPELAGSASDRLATKLGEDKALFPKIEQPDGGPFFEREGLLLALTPEQVTQTVKQLERAEPFLGPVAADPSLRGLMSSLSTMALGVQHKAATVADIAPLAGPLADSLTRVEQGEPEFFSWSGAFSGDKPTLRELRRLLIVHPKLDLDQLEPGARASAAIRATARSLGLDEAHGIKVRLTGAAPLEDEEFASLTDRAWLVAGLMLSAIVLMLFLAVRSWRLVAAILGVTLTGLIVTCAAGLFVFQRFNLISVAFIPLFVGLGVDFGIQFTVRWRAEQHRNDDAGVAAAAAAGAVGPSLTLAAIGIALGFLAFLPTSYTGVSELGAIAGFGMLVALALNLTVLPALVRLAPPAVRPEEADLPWLAKMENALSARRRTVLILSGLAGAAGLLLTPFLHFDFNPLHLKDPTSESVVTLDALSKDPDRSLDSVDVVAPSLAAAQAEAKRLAALPEVGGAVTIESFIPADQQAKLAALGDISLLLDPALNPLTTESKPTDAQVQASLKSASDALNGAAAVDPAAPGSADVRRLAAALGRLASGSPELRARADAALIPGLNGLIDEMRQMVQAGPVSLATLPSDMTRNWIAPDGRARIVVSPRGDSTDNAVLVRFTRAVQKIAPDATGAPISIQAAGATITHAFLAAGAYSFLAITVLLFLVLRRVRDVALTLAPILLTGALTLGTCVLIGEPINDANIIAFPLLMGIGVAFQIYFVMAWRKGDGRLLSSSLARAVFFSALTTATGFGSLWVSRHPGTAGMGKLLMISLFWTLVSALIFQPALMGPAQRRPISEKASRPARSGDQPAPSAPRRKA